MFTLKKLFNICQLFRKISKSHLFRSYRIISPAPWFLESSILPTSRIPAIVMPSHQLQVFRNRFQLPLVCPGTAGLPGSGHTVCAAVGFTTSSVTAVRLDQLTDVGDVQAHAVMGLPENDKSFKEIKLT